MRGTQGQCGDGQGRIACPCSGKDARAENVQIGMVVAAQVRVYDGSRGVVAHAGGADDMTCAKEIGGMLDQCRSQTIKDLGVVLACLGHALPRVVIDVIGDVR